LLAAITVLSMAGCGNEETSPTTLPGGAFTVTYEAGNGEGETVKESAIGGKITLPEPKPDGFSASDMAFAGWNDGKFTYAVGYRYTVTDNVTFNARWGFTTQAGVTAYLSSGSTHMTVDENILLVVCDKGDEDGDAITIDALAVITATNVELDLSALSLGGTFDLSKAKVGVVLILPRAATATTGTYGGTALEVVSGLNVASIGNYAFNQCTTLNTANFPLAKTIGTSAFRSTALQTANFQLAENIGSQAFNKTNLETADFPKAEIIGDNAFNNCTNLEKVDFREATSIGFCVFAACESLATITIGANCDFPEPNFEEGEELESDSISAGFQTVYNEAGKSAGTYTRTDDNWSGPAT
jgi:uncharacterized protein YjbI with pentapeptide repeats